ncbi:hypothetical protein C1I92_16130 [Jiangella anatolica]|uniref:Uncharacterized protein n=2 Tax=Jiangella anatolica TaxID=2670374 RepID=A0A2W2B560_9ACTN|nr:hypothetical protein C1I92_16130 [Jiangella anatolica]
MLAAGGLAATAPASADPVLPTFTYAGEVTVAEELSYNPTGEFIFPSIVHASEHFAAPLGEWYLYYAPHESPGGIVLMYADSLDGPWTEYAANPVIANVWSPHYSVNHVSSPDAIWNEEAGELFLYFHGANDQTRYATSADGITFSYGGTAVTNAMGGTTTTETSYARVFRHPDPASQYQYGMFYMENTTANSRRIRLAESVDGRTWTVRPTPIVTPGSLDAGNVSAANLWEHDGQLYIVYHASSKKIFARTVDPTLTVVGAPVVLHQASGIGEDVGRVASPELVADDGTLYLFYEAGDRLDATIAYATAALAPPFVLDVAATATTGCSATGVATITVAATNESTAPVDVRLTTPIGERKITGLAPGATFSPTFTATGPSLAAGTATVKAFARVDGVAYENTWPIPYGSRSC